MDFVISRGEISFYIKDLRKIEPLKNIITSFLTKDLNILQLPICK